MGFSWMRRENAAVLPLLRGGQESGILSLRCGLKSRLKCETEVDGDTPPEGGKRLPGRRAGAAFRSISQSFCLSLAEDATVQAIARCKW